MEKNIVDLNVFRIEKTLKDNGFVLKKDKERNVMILIKLKNDE
jgi:hypothetical protein